MPKPLSKDKKELIFVVGISMFSATALSWIGVFFSTIADWSGLLTALIFLYLPIEVIERRGESLTDYGVGILNFRKGILQCLKVSLLVMPLYSVAFHYFQTELKKNR